MKLIPKGDYCYDDNGVCPYWETRPDEYPEQEDGYCKYLNKSDWDFNEESNLVIIQAGKEIKYDFDHGTDLRTNKKMHFPFSLLWDQIKSCSVNKDYT